MDRPLDDDDDDDDDEEEDRQIGETPLAVLASKTPWNVVGRSRNRT
jgi:hypothetical protein